MYCGQKNLRYELKNLGYELLLNTGRIDQNWVQFCMSYHLRGHCNDNCMRKAWHRPFTATKTLQLNLFLGPYVATPTKGGPTAPSNI